MVSDYTHKIVVKEDGTQSLIVVPAMPGDSGEWTVVAQNRAGKTSISMTLTVDGRFCHRCSHFHIAMHCYQTFKMLCYDPANFVVFVFHSQGTLD